MVSANKVPSTNFELQITLVSCGADLTAENTTSKVNIGDSSTSTSSVAVCSPPESNLFGNIKIVKGTPYPGAMGGRLYDVGTLCDVKVMEKIDSAWIAFLDCSGCPLITKLANLQNSNPQAVLIYNQTSCVYPSPLTPTTSTALVASAVPAAATIPEAPEASTAPAATITNAPIAASTHSADEIPGESSDSEDNGSADNGDNTLPEMALEDEDDKENSDTIEDDDRGDDADNGRDSIKQAQGIHAGAEPLLSIDHEKVRTLRPRQHPKPIIENDSTHPALIRHNSQPPATIDPADAFIEFPATVATAEQATIDFLFRVLLGPAALAPVPAALNSLKTIVRPQFTRAINFHQGNSDIKAMDTNGSTVTDLMVSISPAFDEAPSSEPKFLSMSNPIFATVIGVLSAILCGVILMSVVHPLIRRRRRHHGHQEPVDQMTEQSNQHASNNSIHSTLNADGGPHDIKKYEHYHDPRCIVNTHDSDTINTSSGSRAVVSVDGHECEEETCQKHIELGDSNKAPLVDDRASFTSTHHDHWNETSGPDDGLHAQQRRHQDSPPEHRQSIECTRSVRFSADLPHTKSPRSEVSVWQQTAPQSVDTDIPYTKIETHEEQAKLDQTSSSSPEKEITMPADSCIPDIPGIPVDPRMENMLRERICKVIGINGNRFIGAQPVSFTRDTLLELQTENYFVSEKSDGVRVLLYCVLHENGQQQVFLVDRKNKFSYVPQLRFPVANDRNVFHNDTIVDGELVSDLEPNGERVVKYLAFDLLAYRGNCITAKPLTSRLARLQCEFITPYREMLKVANPQFVQAQPFKLKWKPPSENTVDFKLTLEFPIHNGAQDFTQKPQFILHEWLGGQQYAPFGQMVVDDELWESWKSTSTHLQNRVVEVNFSPSDSSWRFFRFRDDKEHGNHTSVVRKVLESIRDGVEADEVLVSNFSLLATAAPPPPQATDLLSVTSPSLDDVYKVGETICVRISLVNGTSGVIYQENPKMNILIQKDIRYPKLNVKLGSVSASTLYNDGFKFRALKKYLIKEQANVPFRVRVSFSIPDRTGYVDSAPFRLLEK
ncbi:Dcp1p-Dcp2p decapping enzyme complex alpha subunit [Haplosporangium sp. Z 767]|nr:Dcp1p-Dcp2p decapping enzyme complex alpha subunit [Haplosporangium sp. Z 767]